MPENIGSFEEALNEAFGKVPEPLDEKGRALPENMSDRALLIELVTIGRALSDGVEKMSQNPALKMMGF